jgi:hypothetical protein
MARSRYYGRHRRARPRTDSDLLEVGSEIGLKGDDAAVVGFQQAAQHRSLDKISMKTRTVMQQSTA